MCLQVHGQWHAVLLDLTLHHLRPLEFKKTALEQKYRTCSPWIAPCDLHGDSHCFRICQRLPIFTNAHEWSWSELCGEIYGGFLYCALVQVTHLPYCFPISNCLLKVPAISRGAWTRLPSLQDERPTKTSPQSHGPGLDMGYSLFGGLSCDLRAGALPERPSIRRSFGWEGHLWRLPQARLGPGRLLGDPGLHQRSRRPCKQHPLLASLGAPGQDELCHLPGPHDCHECGEQLCQLQGECQPGTDG